MVAILGFYEKPRMCACRFEVEDLASIGSRALIGIIGSLLTVDVRPSSAGAPNWQPQPGGTAAGRRPAAHRLGTSLAPTLGHWEGGILCGFDRKDVYTRVTERIISDLEQGVRTWLKPWHAEHTAGRITKPLRPNASRADSRNENATRRDQRMAAGSIIAKKPGAKMEIPAYNK